MHVYVDDIWGVGDRRVVEDGIRNTRNMEEKKKFRSRLEITIYDNK